MKIATFTFLGVLLIFSLGAIYAGDVSISEMGASDFGERASFQIDDEMQTDVSQDKELSSLSSSDSSFLNENAKNSTVLTPQSTNVYKDGNYSVVLKDSNNNSTLSNKTIIFVLNDVNYASRTNDEGVADLLLNFNPGNYVVTAIFKGDDLYSACNLTSNVKILPTIKASDLTKYYKGSTKYTATFFDSNGNLLKNTAVSITVNGKTYSRKTNGKGVADLAINLKPGTYNVVADNPITGYQLTTSFKILSTVTASDLKKVIGDSKKFSAKFYKSNGKPLSKQYVKFKIKGKIYKVKTNSEGKAALSLNKFKKGTYKIISYNKDGLAKANTVKLLKIAATKVDTEGNFHTFLPNDAKKIKIKFTTSLGDNSKAGKIIKINANGKTYSKKTDSNGVINFNFASLGKGFFKVVYSYAGNKFFKPSKTADWVTILDTVESKFTVKSTTKFGHGAGALFKVALTAGGVPLAKRTVTFNLEGNEYGDTTDNNGMVSVPIDLKIGNYTINYKSNSKYGIDGTSGSCKISVVEREKCKITFKSGTTYKDSSQLFKVLLTDLNGKPIAGENIDLSFYDISYSGKTDSKGYLIVKTYVSYGPYNVQIDFAGNNKFLPAHISKAVSIKLSQFGSGLNVKNSVSSLGKYLKSSSHCPVNNAKIKSLVKSLTSGLTNKIDKAKAIFSYVRDYVSYEYYYNTHKGAVGTLNALSGNCVDQAHLLIAMYRTAGLHARYVHGSCTFGDGRFGHVWTQVLIGNTWVVGDPISYRNSLGQIKNWKTTTYSLHNRYVSLPF